MLVFVSFLFIGDMVIYVSIPSTLGLSIDKIKRILFKLINLKSFFVFLVVFHITTIALSDNPQSDLEVFTQQIFTDAQDAPTMLYSSYFTISDYELKATPAPLIHATAAPFYELDYDKSIQNARSIFSKLYSDQEFLPRAPDPEEIVIDGEDPKALSEQQLPDDLRAQLREIEKFAEQMDIVEEESAENAQEKKTADAMES